MAERRSQPSSIRCRAKSTTMMPFFFTIRNNTNRHEVRHVTCRRGYGSPTGAACAKIAAGAAAYIKIAQVLRMRPLLVFDLEDDLVLIVRFLDEINVVLRVSVAHQTLNGR